MWIRDVDGRRWSVAREWLPWWPAARRIKLLSLPVDEQRVTWLGFIDTLLEFTITLVYALINLIFLAADLVRLVAEWVAVLLWLPIDLVLRTARIVPWTISARRWEGLRRVSHYRGQAGGWHESRQLIATVGEELRTGGQPQSLTKRQRANS